MEIRRGWSRGFLGFSFPNHDSKSIKEKENKNTTKPGQTTLERVRAQGILINNNLYDACNKCTYDACFNAQKLVQFLTFTNNWLVLRVLIPKTPIFEKLFFKTKSNWLINHYTS